jgi:hypothetical protein
MLAMLAIFTLFLLACDKEPQSGEFTLVVENTEHQELFRGNITFEKEDTLVKLLTSHPQVALKGEEGTIGFFITEVCGLKSGTDKFWNIKVNGEDSMVGISKIELHDQDLIELILVPFNVNVAADTLQPLEHL